jgi:hypothetical protein
MLVCGFEVFLISLFKCVSWIEGASFELFGLHDLLHLKLSFCAKSCFPYPLDGKKQVVRIFS